MTTLTTTTLTGCDSTCGDGGEDLIDDYDDECVDAFRAEADEDEDVQNEEVPARR